MPLNLKWKRGKAVLAEGGEAEATSWSCSAMEGALTAQIVHISVTMPNKWICHVSYQGHVFKFEQASNLRECKEAVGDFIRKQGH